MRRKSKVKKSPKPSEAESATEKPCSSQSEMALPEQDRTGETVTSLQREEEEMAAKLKQKHIWLLEQANNILKLLDSLHRQDYNDIGHQEEEIWDGISDFTSVLFEYVKTLKKRKARGAVCV